MARATHQDYLRVFRFLLRFYFDTGNTVVRDSAKDLPASVTAVTSRGFEVWRAIRPGKKLIGEIGEAVKVDVSLLGRDGVVRRSVVMDIGEATYLPFGVGVELGGQRMGRLDAMDSEVALEGVVFRVFKIRDIVDTP